MNTEFLLDEVLQTNCIVLDSKSTTKSAVVDELATLLVEHKCVDDKDMFLRDVYEREELASTGFEYGIAIPHGKSASVRTTNIAVAKLQTPIEWDSLDDEPVDLVFLFAVAKSDESDNHIKLLATISVILCEEEKVAELKKCSSPETFKQIISN